MDRVFRQLATTGIHMISYGASGLNVTILIDEKDVEKALNSLHQEFFDTGVFGETFEPIQP